MVCLPDAAPNQQMLEELFTKLTNFLELPTRAENLLRNSSAQRHESEFAMRAMEAELQRKTCANNNRHPNNEQCGICSFNVHHPIRQCSYCSRSLHVGCSYQVAKFHCATHHADHKIRICNHTDTACPEAKEYYRQFNLVAIQTDLADVAIALRVAIRDLDDRVLEDLDLADKPVEFVNLVDDYKTGFPVLSGGQQFTYDILHKTVGILGSCLDITTREEIIQGLTSLVRRWVEAVLPNGAVMKKKAYKTLFNLPVTALKSSAGAKILQHQQELIRTKYFTETVTIEVIRQAHKMKFPGRKKIVETIIEKRSVQSLIPQFIPKVIPYAPIVMDLIAQVGWMVLSDLKDNKKARISKEQEEANKSKIMARTATSFALNTVVFILTGGGSFWLQIAASIGSEIAVTKLTHVHSSECPQDCKL